MTYQPHEIISRIEWCRLIYHRSPEERQGGERKKMVLWMPWATERGPSSCKEYGAKFALIKWSGGWESLLCLRTSFQGRTAGLLPALPQAAGCQPSYTCSTHARSLPTASGGPTPPTFL
jgi:hypothetical protein